MAKSTRDKILQLHAGAVKNLNQAGIKLANIYVLFDNAHKAGLGDYSEQIAAATTNIELLKIIESAVNEIRALL